MAGRQQHPIDLGGLLVGDISLRQARRSGEPVGASDAPVIDLDAQTQRGATRSQQQRVLPQRQIVRDGELPGQRPRRIRGERAQHPRIAAQLHLTLQITTQTASHQARRPIGRGIHPIAPSPLTRGLLTGGGRHQRTNVTRDHRRRRRRRHRPRGVLIIGIRQQPRHRRASHQILGHRHAVPHTSSVTEPIDERLRGRTIVGILRPRHLRVPHLTVHQRPTRTRLGCHRLTRRHLRLNHLHHPLRRIHPHRRPTIRLRRGRRRPRTRRRPTTVIGRLGAGSWHSLAVTPQHRHRLILGGPRAALTVTELALRIVAPAPDATIFLGCRASM